jgi:hypothetical protein
MKLVRRPGPVALAWVAAFGIVAVPAVSRAHHAESEPELLARLANESNPAKRAKIEIRLGSLKLEQAAAAYEHDQVDVGAKLLDSYLGWMKQAWNLLHQSGRDASRRPQGFIDLDIALRENARRLADLSIHTPFADRGPIERIGAEADALHTQVLGALFPGGQLQDSNPTTPANPKNAPVSTLRPGDSPR